MTGSEIAFTGLLRQYQNLKEELLDATNKVLTSGQVLDGPYVNFFERHMARRCHRQYAIAVNSCSQALVFAQAALGIDGKVLIPTTSFVATLNSVVMAGNTPAFCDVDDRALLDLEQLDFGLSNSGVKAVMYVNLFGNILDYNRLRMVCEFFNPDGNIKIIEDAAQSFGASYNGIPSGKLGDVSVLSFDPTKNLPNYGSGGMILTDDENVASICYNLRDNGKISNHIYAGTNSKMSEVDCAQMLIKLKYFDEWQRRRTEIADFYTEHLSTYVDPILPNQDVEHAWHKYVIRVHSRDNLQSHLTSRGIQTKIHYEVPLFEHELAFDYYNYSREVFRMGTTHSKEALSLPIYPEMTDAEVETVAETIVEYYAGD
jgi:dTDP-4-amino-4,6-dideoxygalactose transaminase